MLNNLPLQQQLVTSQLGCKSQNIFPNSIISNRNYNSIQIITFIIMLAKALQFIKKHKNKILAATSIAAALYFLYKYLDQGDQTKLTSFFEAIKQQKVKEIVIDQDTIFFRSQQLEWFKTFMGSYSKEDILNKITDTDITFSFKQEFIPKQVLAIAVSCFTSVLSMKYLTHQMHSKTSAPLDLSIPAGNNTYLEDYYGGEDIKQKFRQTIDFLKHPETYEEMGARIRRGILFYGPPGTGKTMLARALANQAGCQFLKMVASEFQEMFVGVGAKRVRQLFAAAKRCKQGCIIFVDELDALGNRANHLLSSHQTTTTINQFLTEMDGFTPTQKVLVVAATNRLDLIDHALLRSGRFDVKIHIPLPNAQQRKGILATILNKKLGHLHNVTGPMVSFIGESAENWCGADLQTLVNEAIYRGIAQKSNKVQDRHIIEAYQELHHLR